MTKEEAKKMLKAKLECLKRETSGTDIDCNYRNCDECNLCYEQGNMGEQKEALDMAIKALEQTELNSSYNSIKPELDCISREAVEKITWEEPSYTDALNILTEVREKVRALPSVTPQRKRGKWIEVDICNCHATLKCSVCDRVIEPTFTFDEYSYEDIKEFYPFCHCGADMRESEDEE